MARAKTGIHVEGAYRLLRTIRQMDAQLVDDTRDASTRLAESFLGKVQSAASGPAASAAVDAMRVYRDRVPKVGFAASTSAGVSGGARASDLFFGWEFGSDSFPQFPSRAPRGRFFYPTLRADGRDLAESWFREIAALLDDTWNKGARSI